APALEPPSADELNGTSLSEATAPSHGAAPLPGRAVPQPQRIASNTPPPPHHQPSPVATPVSAPRTTPARPNAGGPISLVAPNGGGSPNRARPTGPKPDPPPPAAALNIPPQAGAAASSLAQQGAVQWSARPTARRIADLYPGAAARQGVGGR